MVKVIVDGNEVPLQPGDTLDLGSLGLIAWYLEPEAKAIRILQREQQRRVREAIKHVKETQPDALITR